MKAAVETSFAETSEDDAELLQRQAVAPSDVHGVSHERARLGKRRREPSVCQAETFRRSAFVHVRLVPGRSKGSDHEITNVCKVLQLRKRIRHATRRESLVRPRTRTQPV